MIWIIAFVVGIALLLVLGKVLFPADRSRASALMKAYRRLSAEQLAAIADEELVTAVVSNLLAKCENQECDPYALIPSLSRERCGVYSIWLLQKELDGNDPSHLRRNEQFGFSELAADALEWLECSDAAEAVRNYLQTADDTILPTLRHALNTCDIRNRLITLIRQTPEAFCDD